MWDLPRPGIEPVSPALTGGFLTTDPPGKLHNSVNLSLVIILTLNSLLSSRNAQLLIRKLEKEQKNFCDEIFELNRVKE